MKKSVCPRPQSGVERLHVPLLHLDVLLVDEVNVMRDDRRRVFLIARDQLDLHAVGSEEISESSVDRRRARRRRQPGAGLGLAAGRFLISGGCKLRRHRRHVRHGEADVIERGAARRARPASARRRKMNASGNLMTSMSPNFMACRRACRPRTSCGPRCSSRSGDSGQRRLALPDCSVERAEQSEQTGVMQVHFQVSLSQGTARRSPSANRLVS